MATINGRFNYYTAMGWDDGLNDNLYGTSGADTMNGYGGSDYINGGAGHDVINGGMGNDTIRGGTSYDTLTGGAGKDTFSFSPGDSGPSYAGADIITDFNSADDTILFTTSSPAGTNQNYHEGTFHLDFTYELNYIDALREAQRDIGGNIQFAFYTNGHDGYLFADLDHNGAVDTGIELRGLTSLSSFNHSDIH